MGYDLQEIHKYGYAPIGKIEDMIHEAYLQLAALGKTREEIADILGLSYYSVTRYIKKFGIEVRRKEYESFYKDKTVDKFEELLMDGLSVPDIAELWELDMKAMYNWMDRNDMKAARRRAIIRAAKGV